MKEITMRLFIVLIISSVLTGCFSALKDLRLDENVREVESFPMGKNRHMISVRGNVWAKQSELKQKWYNAANLVCFNNFEVEKIEFKEISHMGEKKPLLEGVVKCEEKSQ